MNFLILFIVAMLISAIGFKKFLWFISIGYGFSVAGLGVTMLILFHQHLTVVTVVMSILFIIYGIRLGGYLAIREKSSTYHETVKDDMVEDTKFILKVVTWISCAFLYCCEVAPVFFRLENKGGDDVLSYVGLVIMALGVLLESIADYTKNQFKKKQPKRFCDVGVFRLVRCPNYLGEVLTWIGVFVSGITIYESLLQWLAAIFGCACITYIMFGGARRLELRHNKNYGEDPEYQVYVKKVPILLPFIPLYSVAKHKWLVG